MYFESEEDRLRVEGIAERIEDKTFLRINKGSYGPCKIVRSNAFAEVLGDDAPDIAVLTLLYLYEQGDMASQFNRYGYYVGFEVPLDYYVLRIGNKALFCMESELPKYENYCA